MTFVLPAVFFLVLAEMFTATTTGTFSLHLAVANEVRDPASRDIVTWLAGNETLTLADFQSREAVTAAVERGEADVGLVLQAPFDGAPERAPLLLISDPSRAVAASMMKAQLQQWVMTQGSMPPVATFVDTQIVAGGQRENLVAYSAGAVAFMFLLFASLHGALSILEEEESGILDRILAGPGGVATLVNGKFAFVAMQGFVQVSTIFLVARLGYGVRIEAHFVNWLAVTVAACLAATGFALLIVTASRTRRQAQTLGSTLILLMSAIGGSMVPRFLMPEALQNLGWLTPNTWALEAYTAVLWRDQPLTTVGLPLALLCLTGLAGWAGALWLARRRLML